MWWALGIAQTVPNKSVHSHCQLKKKILIHMGLISTRSAHKKMGDA